MRSVRTRSIAAGLLSVAMSIGGLAGTANAAYDPNNPPYPADANQVADVTIYDGTTGGVVRSGDSRTLLNTLWFSSTADFGTADAGSGRKAALFGYLAEAGKAPGAFSGKGLGAAQTFPAATAPAPVSTFTKPTTKGGSTDSFENLATSFPNTAASTSDFYQLYQLRVKTTFPTPTSTTYAGADIKIDLTAHTWTQVRPTAAAATTTTTALNVSPTTPATSGATETLTATVSPAAAGTIQFADGATSIGSPVTVTAGTASTTTVLSDGSHSLSAAFTPTDSASFTASSSTPQSYTVTPPASAPGAPTGVGATAADSSANVSWTAPASTGGSAITKYTVTASPTSGSPVTKDVTTGTSTTVTGLTNGTQYAITVTATNGTGTGLPSSPAVNVTPAAVPGAPTGVSATAAAASANVSWTAPASTGGSAITKYTVTASPTSGSPVTKDVTTGTSTTMTGLANGTQYAVTVKATNSVGTGPASSPAVNVTPAAAPGAATGITANPADTSANVSWTAPANTGGSAITKYTVTATPTSGSPVTKDVTTGTTTTLTGLTNGTQYAVTVTATNAIGTGPASSPAVNVTPAVPTAPGAPTGVSAAPASGAAYVSWTAPVSTGGSPITKYTVTATPFSGSPVTKDVASGTNTTLAGLTNGTQYAVTVTATNAVGTGPASSPAVNVTPSTVAAAVPGAPTDVRAVAGNASANVSWIAPASTGGSAITKYTVTATPGSGLPVSKDVASGTSTTVTGLANGTEYAITVTATNASGTGPASSPALFVTPGLDATSVTLSLTRSVVTQGDAVTAVGQLTGGDVAGETITLRFLSYGHTTVVRTTTTGATGAYTYDFHPGYNTTVVAYFEGSSTQAPSHSSARGEVTRPRLHWSAPSNGTRTHARTITVRGAATPNKAGAVVELLAQVGDHRVVLMRTRVSVDGTFSFTRTYTAGTKVLYAHVVSTPDNAEGFTSALTLWLV